MAFGPAYFSDRIRDPMAARDSEVFARIRGAGPWSYADSMHDGKRGVLAFWADAAGVPVTDHYGAPRTASDGLVYLPPKVLPEQATLAKATAIAGTDYTTARGVTLTIPWAALAATEIDFAADALGAPADDFARRAWDVWERRESIKLNDPAIIQLVRAAIEQNYRVTAELLNDLRWLTSRDIDPIFACIMGYDPKAFAGAVASLPESAPASSHAAV